ncbi:MAG: hypothetical protein J6B81_03470 [Spirochaetaceae bacterium]|nr:hypothetical protein [Spirochaetaceae bacterium]
MFTPKKSLTALKYFLFGLVIVFITIWCSVIVFGLIKYNNGFAIRTKITKNPGLNDGFVPQGLTWNYDNKCFYTTGYMKDGSASRIYKINPETNEEVFYVLKSNGQDFYGHTGGLQYTDGYFYLANEGVGLFFFPADSAVDKTIEIGEPIQVNNHSSFVFTKEDFAYVGEFNDSEKYICTNDFSYNGVNHKAIVSKYKKDDFSEPVAIYSVGNHIQGFAILQDGTIILSKSYRLNPSEFLVYKPDQQIMTGKYMQEVEVCFLGEPSEVLSLPPMSEDLDVYNNKLIYMSESASKKYIYGNLYFDRFIYSIDVN